MTPRQNIGSNSKHRTLFYILLPPLGNNKSVFTLAYIIIHLILYTMIDTYNNYTLNNVNREKINIYLQQDYVTIKAN